MVKLDPFFDAIEPIRYKNNGGCLFFAYCFWKWLKENGHPTESFEIVQYDWSDKLAIKRNLRFIEGSENVPSSSYHFTWLYTIDGEELEYDAEGVYYPGLNAREVLTGLNTKFVSLVDEFCIKALNESDWNSRFNREEAIEIVESSLLIDLSEIEPC